MRTTKYTVIWLVLFSLAIVSCNKENPAYNRENIKATWLFDTKDGRLIPEKEYMFYEFRGAPIGGNPILSLQGVKNTGDGNYKWGSESLVYEVKCSDLEIEGAVSGFYDDQIAVELEQVYEIIEQKDSSLTISPILYQKNGIDVIPDFTLTTMRKVPSMYTDSLKGVWQVELKGGEPINTFRLEFLEKGKLNFYLREDNGAWAPLNAESEDYYNYYDHLLIITLYNNELLGRKDKWDVSFFNIVSLSPFSQKMILSKGNVEYSFTMIESGEEEDEAL